MQFDRHTTASMLRFNINRIRYRYALTAYSTIRCVSYDDVRRQAVKTRETLENCNIDFDSTNRDWWRLVELEYEASFLYKKYLRHRY